MKMTKAQLVEELRSVRTLVAYRLAAPRTSAMCVRADLAKALKDEASAENPSYEMIMVLAEAVIDLGEIREQLENDVILAEAHVG